jgi:hypothetical protein
LHTDDGGVTWIEQSNVTTGWLYDVCFVDEQNGWSAGLMGTILNTANGGQTWNDQSIESDNDFLGVYFIDQYNGWAVGFNGFIVHTDNGGIVGVEYLNIEADNFKIYPNPSSNQITIELPTTPQKNTTLTISNTNGQQLILQPIAESQTEINITHLPAGIYIIKVWNDKDVMVRKVIKK